MTFRQQSLVCAIIALVGFGTSAAQAVTTTIFTDNFESYANTAQMNAVGAWGDSGTTANPGVLVTSGGNTGKFMSHPGGVSGRHLVPGTIATNANPIIWSFDFMDTSGATRVTGGLRNNGNSNNLLEMGLFNNPTNPSTNANAGTNYAARTILNLASSGSSPFGNSGWITIQDSPSRQPNDWHTFKATIFADYILYELDLGADGTVDVNRFVQTPGNPGKVYDVLRLGGPSDVSSAGSAGFDNVFLGQGLAAPTPGVFNTGVSNSNTVLLGNAIDPHFTVRSVASAGAAVNLTPGNAAFVVPVDGFPIPPWVGANSTSGWISSQPDDGNEPGGFFDYNLTFEIQNTTALITGQWATDNTGIEIFVNGVATGHTASGFGAFTPFFLDQGDAFVNGLNVLTFRVQNLPGAGPNPTGLRVEFLSFVDTNIPEPATLTLGALGLLALAGRRSRKEQLA